MNNNPSSSKTSKAEGTTEPKKEEDGEEKIIDPLLCETSEFFDPLKALYQHTDSKFSPKSRKVYHQNLAAFETALKKHGIWDMNKKKNLVTEKTKNNDKPGCSKDAITTERRFLPHQMAIQVPNKSNIKQRHKRNIFKMMENSKGPMEALRRWVSEEKKIRVYIRHEHGIRGHVDGNIICYDKHWNLLLKDVEEVWQRRKFNYCQNKVACGQPVCCKERLAFLGLQLPEQTVKSINRKNVQITRRLQQLMIRGEQVVLINVIENLEKQKEEKK